jgi:hypothetical protein
MQGRQRVEGEGTEAARGRTRGTRKQQQMKNDQGRARQKKVKVKVKLRLEGGEESKSEAPGLLPQICGKYRTGTGSGTGTRNCGGAVQAQVHLQGSGRKKS